MRVGKVKRLKLKFEVEEKIQKYLKTLER